MPNAKIRRAILGVSLSALALSALPAQAQEAVSYTHLRAHET